MTRSPRRLLTLVALTGAAIGGPATAAHAWERPTWADLAPLATEQPVQTHQAIGEQKAIMIAVPGGGWGAGGDELFRLYSYLDWWTTMLQEHGITVDVVGHRGHSGNGTVARQIADIVNAMERARKRAPGTPICIYGLSSGGQLAVMSSMIRPDLADCVIADGAPMDLDRWLPHATQLHGLRLEDFVASFFYPSAANERFDYPPKFPEGLKSFDPARQADRIGRLFTINAGRNPDGSESDDTVGSQQGELMRRRIPDRTIVRYVHAAADGEPALSTAHLLYSSYLDLTRGGAKEQEARKVYDEAARWAVQNATPPGGRKAATTPGVTPDERTPALGPTPVAPAPRAKVVGRTLRLDARGRIRVRLRCTDATTACRFALRVRAAGGWSRTVTTRLGKGSASRQVLIALSAKQRRAVARSGRVRADLRAIAVAPRPDGSQQLHRIFLTRAATKAR
jgi:hypothetical protein